MPEKTTHSYADLADFPDDNLRREILDGELIVSPSPKTRHQEILARLHLLFGKHIEEQGGGKVYFAPLDVILSDINVVEPDLLFVSDEQLEIMTEMNIQGVPALLIEVLSNPRIDKVRKRDVYARFGVPEYWIADPDADRIEVYRHDGAGYGKPEIFDSGDTLTTTRVLGLAIDVGNLFRR